MGYSREPLGVPSINDEILYEQYKEDGGCTCSAMQHGINQHDPDCKMGMTPSEIRQMKKEKRKVK